jgi:hypothetical protein
MLGTPAGRRPSRSDEHVKRDRGRSGLNNRVEPPYRKHAQTIASPSRQQHGTSPGLGPG